MSGAAAHPSRPGATAGPSRRRPARVPRPPLAAADGADLARRHSRRVALLKMVLPAVAVCLVGVVVIWPQLQETGEAAFGVTYAGRISGGMSGQTLEGARYQGFDSRNQPFTVTAREARELTPGSRIVRLDQPQADMSFSDGSWAMVGAATGDYDQPARRLDLAGGITVYHDSGTELRTTSAAVDLARGLAWGDSAVEGNGPFGAVAAEGFAIDQNERTVRLTGKARLLINPDAPLPGAPLPGSTLPGDDRPAAVSPD